MKIGLAVAPADAPPSAFVVLRGDPCALVDRCAELGFDGLELALRHAGQVDPPALRRRLAATGLAIPCISSGQVFACDRLYFTHPDPAIRSAAVERIQSLIRLAAEFGAMVNTGRVRGLIHDGEDPTTAQARYLDCLAQCLRVAEPLGVTLLIEPVNRYEVNFINSCEEGLALVRAANSPWVRLMPDLFHMNIEDASLVDVFRAAKDEIAYVHVADSNRLAPGWGHLPFDEIFAALREMEYNGWLTAEILPRPDPESAAAQTARFLREHPLLQRENLLRLG